MDDFVIQFEKVMGNFKSTESDTKTDENDFVVIDEKPASTSMITGIIYDEAMTEYSCVTDINHVERPARITSIYKRLNQDELLDRCKILSSRKATREEVLLKHKEKHYNDILNVENLLDNELEELEGFYDSIYFHKGVTKCSLLSAGSTIKITEEVIQGNIKNGAAVVRPPGHHALEHCSMGFCHFNNVALAAAVAIEKYNMKKILIVDWDVHYGNGIHKMFEDDPRVLYFSMHRYDNKSFWPCLEEGNYTAIGCGQGEGFNIHVAWNRASMGDSEYKAAFETILIPIATEYNPELVLVSAGFDSGKNDPLGRCCVSPAGYSYMTKELMKFANGKVVIVLEGGYNLYTIARSMSACVSTLLGDDPLDLGVLEEPFTSALKSIANTKDVLSKYWKCLEHSSSVSVNSEETESPVSSSSSDDSISCDVIKDNVTNDKEAHS